MTTNEPKPAGAEIFLRNETESLVKREGASPSLDTSGGVGLMARALGSLTGVSDQIKAEVARALDEALPASMRTEFLKRISAEAVANTIKAEVERLLDKSHPALFVHVTDSLGDRRILTRQHFLFPAVISLLNARDYSGNGLNVALVGPAGTGKSHMAMAAAEALGDKDCMLLPMSKHTTKSDLLGFMDAQGRYVPSALYRAMKEGLVFVADEFDACDPGIATILNGAVANKKATFPNLETVKAHPNFRPVFCMNTFGTGADDQYSGRTRLDAATLDRMVFIRVPNDEGLEAALVGILNLKSPELDLERGGRFAGTREILQTILSLRGAVEGLGKRIVISPRATINAVAMHEAGFGKDWILDAVVYRGMTNTDRAALVAKAGIRAPRDTGGRY